MYIAASICVVFIYGFVYFIEYVRSFRKRTSESESSKFCEVNFDQIFFERASSIYRRICNALYVSIYQLIFQYTKKYCFSFEMMHEVYFI